MAPKHESFKDYEDHDSCKENREDIGSRDVGECMRNQSEERRPQKRADGVTDQVGNEPLPDSRWKKQKRSRKADGTRACEQTEAENPQYRITLTRCIHVLLQEVSATASARTAATAAARRGGILRLQNAEAAEDDAPDCLTRLGMLCERCVFHTLLDLEVLNGVSLFGRDGFVNVGGHGGYR